MRNVGKFVDMANTPEEMKKDTDSVASAIASDPYKGPKYPWGLAIRLTEQELKKLDLDDDPEIGDTIHLFALVRVTSVSSNERDGEPNSKCIELQITHLALEDEDEENEMSTEDRAAKRYSKSDD